jgi:hypothetical protein
MGVSISSSLAPILGTRRKARRKMEKPTASPELVAYSSLTTAPSYGE